MKVFISDKARGDLLRIYTFVEARNPRAAEAIVQRIDEKFDQLSNLPFIGRERSSLAPGLRRVVVGNHLIFYLVGHYSVTIVRVIDVAWTSTKNFEDDRTIPESSSTARSATAAMSCRCGSITRTPTSPASSITPTICASWSAAAPTICGCSAPISAPVRGGASGRRRASPSWCARCRSSSSSRRAWTTCSTSSPRTQEVKGASITLHQRVLRGDELLIEAHVRVAFVSGGRARPIPKALRTAMRGRSGPHRRLDRCQTSRRTARQGRRPAASHVKTLHMSWSKHGGRSGDRGYHHGNLKEALIRAALELIAQEGAGRLHLRGSGALGGREPGRALSAFSRPRRTAGRRRAARLRSVRGGADARLG